MASSSVTDPLPLRESTGANIAVDHLQRAVLSGRPMPIPGALEPRQDSHPHVVESDVPHGPNLSPLRPEEPTRREPDREAWGTPAAPVTLLDFVALRMLHATEFMIRLLRPRTGLVRRRPSPDPFHLSH